MALLLQSDVQFRSIRKGRERERERERDKERNSGLGRIHRNLFILKAKLG